MHFDIAVVESALKDFSTFAKSFSAIFQDFPKMLLHLGELFGDPKLPAQTSSLLNTPISNHSSDTPGTPLNLDNSLPHN
ncbi:hypothetical protein GP475_10875 [Corynebacterium poyangense]|uniref:Uncharacterized protein n=1 Tax=Corynebacterium poyangense TaxID=2684405 RepID=A0A7H0SRA1_9CORY|nr:hypothetical protein [Corynebacterium poyangense]QNQ91076.1 hypothetical protein GP475_10875 [Corynebacterium poyangense]